MACGCLAVVSAAAVLLNIAIGTDAAKRSAQQQRFTAANY